MSMLIDGTLEGDTSLESLVGVVARLDLEGVVAGVLRELLVGVDNKTACGTCACNYAYVKRSYQNT